MEIDRNRRFASEFLGTALLLAAVVGSGIMAEKLSGGNTGLALLANSLATGAALFVLITILGPISGAHFNPAVTLVMRLKQTISTSDAAFYAIAQVAGGIAGVLVTHVMFDLTVVSNIGDRPQWRWPVDRRSRCRVRIDLHNSRIAALRG